MITQHITFSTSPSRSRGNQPFGSRFAVRPPGGVRRERSARLRDGFAAGTVDQGAAASARRAEVGVAFTRLGASGEPRWSPLRLSCTLVLPLVSVAFMRAGRFSGNMSGNPGSLSVEQRAL